MTVALGTLTPGPVPRRSSRSQEFAAPHPKPPESPSQSPKNETCPVASCEAHRATLACSHVTPLDNTEREKGDALKKLRNLLESVMILPGKLLSSTHGIADTWRGHFKVPGQFCGW